MSNGGTAASPLEAELTSAFDTDFAERNVVGLNLKAARNIAGLSQKEVGRFSGKSFTTLQRWERGQSRVPVDYAIAIALLLHCRPDSVLGLTEGTGYLEALRIAEQCAPGELTGIGDSRQPDGQGFKEDAALSFLIPEDQIKRDSIEFREKPGVRGEYADYLGFRVYSIEESAIRFVAPLGAEDKVTKVLKESDAVLEAAKRINKETCEYLRQRIGENIAHARRVRECSQGSLADMLGTNRFTIASYEAGKTPISADAAIAASLLLGYYPQSILGTSLQSAQSPSPALPDLWQDEYTRTTEGMIVSNGEMERDRGRFSVTTVGCWNLVEAQIWARNMAQMLPSGFRAVACSSPLEAGDVLDAVLEKHGLKLDQLR